MPSNPRKYGVTFFGCAKPQQLSLWMAWFILAENLDSGSHRNLANDIVMKLCSVYFGTGRDIYVDRYFTSHGLVCNLLQQNLTLLGTIMANRREVPSQFKAAKGREIESAKALYDHSNKILLLLYVPKRNKNVLMMSSSHFSISITDCHKISTVITTISINEELILLMKTVKNSVAWGKQIIGQWPVMCPSHICRARVASESPKIFSSQVMTWSSHKNCRVIGLQARVK